MKLAVVSNAEQKQELLSRPFKEGVEIFWLEKPDLVSGVDGYIDLLFEEDTLDEKKSGEVADKSKSAEIGVLEMKTRVEALIKQQQSGSIVIVSAVIHAGNSIPDHFIRINGWNSFLDKERMEMTGGRPIEMEKATRIMDQLNRKAEWVPDQIGFIAPRVIASVINEAYYALQEGVSDKAQIDTAMKLGTNYPMGPFAWGEKIGIKKIDRLLNELTKEDARYRPAQSLIQEAAR